MPLLTFASIAAAAGSETWYPVPTAMIPLDNKMRLATENDKNDKAKDEINELIVHLYKKKAQKDKQKCEMALYNKFVQTKIGAVSKKYKNKYSVKQMKVIGSMWSAMSTKQKQIFAAKVAAA